MSSLRKGILGGLAGGFEAMGELADQSIKEKLEEQKNAALLKRQKALTAYSNQLNYETQSKLAGERREYESDVREEEEINRQGILSEARGYEEKSKKEAFEKQKELETHKNDLAINLAKVKAASKGMTKDQLKYLESQAYDDVYAYLKTFGGELETENKKDFNFYNLSQEEREDILKTLDRSGFKFHSSENAEGQFNIVLASFNPDNINLNKTEKVSKEKSKTAQMLERLGKGKSSEPFGEMKSSHEKTTDGSKGEQPDGIVAPQKRTATEQIKPLSKNPKQWNVEVQTADGQINQLDKSISDFKTVGGTIKSFWDHYLKPGLQTAQSMFMEQPYESLTQGTEAVLGAGKKYIKDTPERIAKTVLKETKLIVTLPDGTKREMTPEEIKRYKAAMGK